MKIVWIPSIIEPYYKNVWFIVSTQEVWMEPDRYPSIGKAMNSRESDGCIRLAILELADACS